MKFIRYSYLKDRKLLIKSCSGKIVRHEMINEFQKVFAELQFSEPINVLLDIQAVDIKASVQASKLYTDFFLDKSIYGFVNKIAILTNTPSQVVQTIMFIDGVKHLNKSIQTFSSVKHAMNWLQPNVPVKEVQNYLKLFTESTNPRKAS